MRFLLDANMPRSAAGAVQRLGHEAVDVRDVGLGGAEDAKIALYAKEHRFALITRGLDFSDVRNYPPAEYTGIIVLELPDDAIAATVDTLLLFMMDPTCRRLAFVYNRPMRTEDSHSGSEAHRGIFRTTHGSVVLAAADPDSLQATEAMEKLCRAYEYPLYAYVRSSGYAPPDAEDLTQEFFARLIAKDYVSAAQPERGKFRWFLMSAIKRFLINEWERASAIKRGAGRSHISFDGEKAEDRYRLEAADRLTPDKLFDRAWAVNLIEAANRSL